MPIANTKIVKSISIVLFILSLPVLATAETSLSCSEIPFCSAPPNNKMLYSQPLSTPFGTYVSFFMYEKGQVEGVSVNHIVYHYLSYCIEVTSFGENYDTVHSARKLYRIEASFSDAINFKKLKHTIMTKFWTPEIIKSKDSENITLKWNINNTSIEIIFDSKKNTGNILFKYIPLSNILEKEKNIIDAENYGSDNIVIKVLELKQQYQNACVNPK